MNLKNNKTVLLFLSLLTSLELFSAQDGLYLQVGAGMGLEEKIKGENNSYIYDKGYLATAAIGYQYKSFSLELEGLYKKNELYSSTETTIGKISVDGDLVQNTQMLNLYYSGYNRSQLVSSIGLGVGLTTLTLEDLVELESPQDKVTNKNILSYQGMFSVGYMFTDHITFAAKYRYFMTTSSDDFKSNSDNIFTLDLKYLF